MTETRNRVLAVVVTYNRLELLKECLSALEAQSSECDILLVDNASTDGTEAYAEGKKGSGFFHARMKENLGGAGGFHYGIKWGAEQGYEFLWVMDDDCIPSRDALEKLLEADKELEGRYGWLSSLCLWTDGNLCPMNIQMKTPYRQIRNFDQRLVPAQMASFVSLFLKRETVAVYGLPIAEFVIWTDDWEYTRRISRKVPCYVATESKVIHAMKNKTVVNIATDTEDRMGRYRYYYRNDAVLYRREGIQGRIWLAAKDGWHAVRAITAGHPGRVKIIFNGYRQGRRFHPEAEKIRMKEDAE